MSRTASERLNELDYPLRFRGVGSGAVVVDFGYGLGSQGPLGGHHVTVFVAVGEEARLAAVYKDGWFGLCHQSVPIEKHVQALRDLGFTTIVFPSGTRYELRSWPGIRRVRDDLG